MEKKAVVMLKDYGANVIGDRCGFNADVADRLTHSGVAAEDRDAATRRKKAETEGKLK